MSKRRLSKKFWNPNVNKLSPYTPGEQPKENNYIKLNTNENPDAPSKKVKKAIFDNLKNNKSDLRLYPDPHSKELKNAIAKNFKVKSENIFVGNGSDEVLAFCFHAFFSKRGKLAIPEITYSFYPSLAKLFEVDISVIKISEEFSVNLNHIDSTTNSVLLPNPNATTGKNLTRKYIESFLLKNPKKIFVIDEAYVDYGTESCIPLIKKYHNILVVQTFSKSRGLAGIRLGFVIGNESLIEALNRVKNSFNSYPVDRLASIAGIASLSDKDWFNSNRKKVIKNREFLTKELVKIGFKVIPSKGNFILASHSSYRAKKIFEELKKRKILIRVFKDFKIRNWVRITVGSFNDCKKLLDELSSLVINS
tara:strand:- start:2156 stop:3247 length:1092 start_codon:yes stop_codon:yes gene_type:complete